CARPQLGPLDFW
nr:immunoglobulin heavy chain junction region [Mus musculus]